MFLRVVSCFAVVLALALAASPAGMADGGWTDTTTADGDGSFLVEAPPGNVVACAIPRNWSVFFDSVFFSGQTSCEGGQFNMAALYGRVALLEGGETVAVGDQSSCSGCGSVSSSGAAGVFPGFPYTLRYETTLQLPSGYAWIAYPGSCSRIAYPTLSCTFLNDFTA